MTDTPPDNIPRDRIYIIRDSKYCLATDEEIDRAACFEILNGMALIRGLLYE